jgi:hypothetical protein
MSPITVGKDVWVLALAAVIAIVSKYIIAINN